jgi:hypothetical protein
LHPTVGRRLLSGYIPFYQRNVDVLEGQFAFTAGNARGLARAVRLQNGRMPDGVAPFTCMGKSVPKLPPFDNDGSDRPSEDLN